MAISVSITYVGQQYRGIGDAFVHAALHGMKSTIEEKLKAIELSKRTCNGRVTVDIKSDFSIASIYTVGIPADLKNKIVAAFRI